MKKLLFTFILVAFIAIPTSVFAEEVLYLDYNCVTKKLQIELVTDKPIHSWCENDVEMIQYDRLILDAFKKPQIYMVVYGVGTVRLTVSRLPISGRTVITGSIDNVPMSANFQIYGKIWKGTQQTVAFWAIGPNEPTRASSNFRGVKTMSTPLGWIFKTIPCCP